MKRYKKLSDEKLKPPFDADFNKQYKYYQEKERSTKLKQSNEFWLNKLYGSEIKYDLSLGQVFYLLELLKKAYNDCSLFIDNPCVECTKDDADVEKMGIRRLIGKLREGLDNNLCGDKVEKFWKENLNVPDVNIPDEFYY